MANQLLHKRIDEKIHDITEYLIKSQANNGAWNYCFEAGTVTDAYMIILLRHLDINDPVIDHLIGRIIDRQENNGTWKLFLDESEGDLSATIECYYALLLTGIRKKSDPEMMRARDFILSKGGPHHAGSLTKVMLALTGHYPWRYLSGMPLEIVLLPIGAPVNFFDLVGYTRVHAAPILVCSNKKYILRIAEEPDLSDLYSPESEPPQFILPHSLVVEIQKVLRNTTSTVIDLKTQALKKLESFMLDRTEEDGTLYSYFTTTFLMIFALLALGYDKGHPVVVKAINGLKAMIYRTESVFHQQETTSTVWDTALISYALQQAGLPYKHPAVVKSSEYLISKQHTKYGDWQVHNPAGKVGGWGFSNINTINPDVDDTSYALRALYGNTVYNEATSFALTWKAGLDWLMSMQNNDGGWPAFEKNTYKKWPNLLPIPDAKPVLTDPSMADLTGRTLEFLGNYAGMSLRRKEVRKGVQWLLKNQRADSSWYGRWGITYIYGTWSAVTGLISVGIDRSHPAVQKAVKWLLSVQNPDGGWGESCLSDSLQKYIPLGFSTVSQTAWALDALVTAGLKDSQSVIRGISLLLKLTGRSGSEITYPTGAGLSGAFYIHYHSYQYVWPLLTLGNYLKA